VCVLCIHRARAVRVRQERDAVAPCAEDGFAGVRPSSRMLPCTGGLGCARPQHHICLCHWSQIEVAYDILLMESMKRRLTGEADVARSVRFADVPQPKKKQVGI